MGHGYCGITCFSNGLDPRQVFGFGGICGSDGVRRVARLPETCAGNGCPLLGLVPSRLETERRLVEDGRDCACRRPLVRAALRGLPGGFLRPPRPALGPCLQVDACFHDLDGGLRQTRRVQGTGQEQRAVVRRCVCVLLVTGRCGLGGQPREALVHGYSPDVWHSGEFTEGRVPGTKQRSF